MKDRDYKEQELLRAGWKKHSGTAPGDRLWYRPGAATPSADLDQAFDNERLFPEKVRIALQRKADSPSRPVKSKTPVDSKFPAPLRIYGGDFLQGRESSLPTMGYSTLPVNWAPGIPSAPAKRYKVATNRVAEFVVDCKTGRSVARYTYGQFVNPRELATRYADHLNHFDAAAVASTKMGDVYDHCFQVALDREIEYLNKVRAAIGNDMELKELISGRGRKDLRYRLVPIGVLERLGLRDIDKA